jgi:hypothetical protein
MDIFRDGAITSPRLLIGDFAGGISLSICADGAAMRASKSAHLHYRSR